MITDIVPKGNSFDVVAPYDSHLVSFLKNISGSRWISESKAWNIPLYGSTIILTEGERFLSGITRQKLTDVMKISQYELPYNLKTPLLGFQEEGYRFLLSREKCILAARTGRGKKAMSLAAVLYLFQIGARAGSVRKCLIISIASDIFQWQEDFDKFIPLDRDFIVVASGAKKQRQKDYLSFITDPSKKLLILNYEKAIQQDFDYIIQNLPIDSCVILDECSYIKNFSAHRSKSILRLNANYKFALSATPVQNSPEDIFNINRFLDVPTLGSLTDFRRRYATMGRIWTPNGFRDVIVGWKREHLEEIERRIRPILLRLSDNVTIPPSRKTVYIPSTDPERKVYDLIERTIRRELDRDGATIKTILPLWTILREYADHPRLLINSNAKIMDAFNTRDIFFNIEGSKLDEFMRIMEILKDDDRQIVVFVSYIEMANILRQKIQEKYGDIVVCYYGDMKEEEVIRPFQHGKFRILISNSKGTHALNLQNAGILIHYDLDWNPKELEQREGRVEGRIGQQNDVLVMKLIMQDEDRIERYMEAKLLKKNVYSDVIVDGQTTSTG